MSKKSKRKQHEVQASRADESPEYDPFDLRDWAQLYGLSGLGPTMSKIGATMFMPLSRQIAEYRSMTPKLMPALDRFFDYVLQEISDEQYAEVQVRHLNKSAIQNLIKLANENPGMQWAPWEKYLAFPFWVSAKFKYALQLGLDKKAPMDILDLGVGPAHFPFVCQYLGHACLGIDAPLAPTVAGLDAHIYDDLCRLFKVNRVSRRIERLTPLNIEGRFDLVTSLMTIFHCPYEYLPDGRSIRRPWSADEWRFFLNHLKQDLLKPEFQIHLQLSKVTTSSEVDYLKGLSSKFDLERFVFTLNHEAQI